MELIKTIFDCVKIYKHSVAKDEKARFPEM